MAMSECEWYGKCYTSLNVDFDSDLENVNMLIQAGET